MMEYEGILEITDYAQGLINDGLARIEGANVVWNPGSGYTGVVEWGKFFLKPVKEGDESTQVSVNADNSILPVVGAAIGITVVVAAGVAFYNARQNKINKINNRLITCLSLYILEASEANVQTSTKLDLKLAINDYLDNSKLFKNKVDTNLLKSIELIMKQTDLGDEFELSDKIIQLDNYIKRKNQNRSKDGLLTSAIFKI